LVTSTTNSARAMAQANVRQRKAKRENCLCMR
jgi:hypothetical protein